MKPSVLLVDDNQREIDDLQHRLKELLADDGEVRAWVPTGDVGDPAQKFGELVDAETVLVVTDYDLTAKGRTGLFGSTVVGWCKKRILPVADYSRGNLAAVPKEPSLFELRVPAGADAAARFIASVFQGFQAIRHEIEKQPALKNSRGPAALLAQLLGVPKLETDLALYAARLSADATLLEMVVPGKGPTPELLRYIVSHVLLNSVLRFPGPIVNAKALLAYVACGPDAKLKVLEVFEPARYQGPFKDVDDFYWTSKVDEILAALMADVDGAVVTETEGELNRLALEKRLGELQRPSCDRCEGVNGGYLCPFTQRTVCPLGHCSVASNSWVPQGARLCRIERDFYDEWAPILGF